MQPKKIKKVPPKKLAESSSEESEQENDALCIYCSEPYGNSVEGEGWIQCSRCPQWAHDACAGIDENAWDDFICDLGTFQCKKNKDGVDFRHFRKCRHVENISFEHGAVDYSRLPILILKRFCEIRKFLTNRLRESPCIYLNLEA
jgi:hypothetical protein